MVIIIAPTIANNNIKEVTINHKLKLVYRILPMEVIWLFIFKTLSHSSLYSVYILYIGLFTFKGVPIATAKMQEMITISGILLLV
jgi:hypothetical protein